MKWFSFEGTDLVHTVYLFLDIKTCNKDICCLSKVDATIHKMGFISYCQRQLKCRLFYPPT